MAIDFPNTPSVNQLFSVGDRTWQWNGTAWVAASSAAYATLTGVQTLTNKTLTAPDINGGTADDLTSLSVRDTSAAFDVAIAATSNPILTANRTLTINMENAARSLNLGGNLDIANNFTTSGNNALTLTTTGATNVTLPASGTLVNTAVTSLSSLATVGTITSGTWNGSAITYNYGGTGITSYAAGDIIYASATNTLSKLTISATSGQALVVSSGAPAWTTLTLENLPGAFIKKSVRVATTADLGGTYSNGTSGVGATLTITSTTTLDGVTLANGDRILVKDQATTLQNGIYIRTSATVLTRATDADSPVEISAGIVAVDEGTTNGGLAFDTDFKATDTIGTTAMTWNRMIDAASTFYIGTTAVTAGRASANLALTGITSITGGTGATAVALNTSATATTSTSSGAININTGNATGTTSNSGSIGIDVGTATLTRGSISIGTTNANTVNIGNSSATVNIYTSTLDVQNGPIVTSSQSNNPTSTSGVYLGSAGKIHAAVNGGTVMQLNRNTSDGEIVGLYQAATLEGSISVSGTTVTYGSFAGTHWSQFENNDRPDILPGTVLENTGEMCEWDGEENEQLTRVKVSDTEDSSGVYGVFMRYDNDDEDYPNDVYVLALGAWMVRVDADEVVFVGDLLSSKGNGCAKVQDDDIIRSKTIGKVTSAIPVTVYPDGSKLIPCVLYCG